jgi:hypothetical protein
MIAEILYFMHFLTQYINYTCPKFGVYFDTVITCFVEKSPIVI